MNELHDVEAFYRGVLGPEPHVPDGLLIHYLRGRATGSERERIELHLSACTRCREDAETLKQFAATLIAPAPALRVSDEETPPLVAPRKRVPSRHFPVVPALFLVVNAIGLGAIARLATKPTPLPSPTPLPTPAAPPTDLTRFRAAYEAQLAKEHNKVALLEKQLQIFKAGKPVVKPAPPVRSANESLRFPGDREGISLSTHPTLLWKAVPNAAKYATTLLTADGAPLLKAKPLGTDWRVANSLPRGTRYTWHVVALSKDGKAIGKPQQGKVTIIAKDDAAQIARQLKQLAKDLERLGFKAEAASIRARAAMIMAK